MDVITKGVTDLVANATEAQRDSLGKQGLQFARRYLSLIKVWTTQFLKRLQEQQHSKPSTTI